MTYKESEHTELKEIVNADFKKEVVAFANTDGGEIFVGIAKDGSIVGVDNAEAEMERISNMIRDGIKPDLSAYTTVSVARVEGKDVIRVTVSQGEKKPYHLSDKGLKPSGVYMRHGVTSAPVSDEAIRQMIKASDGTTFDKVRSIHQELTFDYAAPYFAKRKIGFEENNKRSLGLITSDGYYTNAAWLLSDQCEHSIKAAVYEGNSKIQFKTRKEFFGSVLKQMDDAYEFLALNNNLNASFEGLHRIDSPDYPEYALREALLNSIVHRDYDYSGSILINIFTDRMEFVSIGGLVRGITIEDIMQGVSQSRNSLLASVFYRLELIESYGTGIQRILETYKGFGVQPSFSSGPTSFLVTLPNMHAALPQAANAALNDEERILALLAEKGSITRKDVETLLGCSAFPASKELNQLVNSGKVVRVGKARATRYIILKN